MTRVEPLPDIRSLRPEPGLLELVEDPGAALTRHTPVLLASARALVRNEADAEGGSFGSCDYRHLVVDNVVILVRTNTGGRSASDREFLTQLVAALRSQQAVPSPTN